MKITVDHNFVSVRFQRSKPCDEFAVFGERALVVIIRHHKNRTNADAVRAQFRNNRARDLLSARGDVVQRHDGGIGRGAGSRNERKELRCRNCTHIANFLSSSSFEQGKKVPSRNDGFPAVAPPMDG